MMGYDYEVVYRSGKSNTVADILSWKPEVVERQLMSISTVTTDLLQWIKESWLQDAKLQQLIKTLEHSSRVVSNYTWTAGLLKRNGKIVVEDQLNLRQDLWIFFTTASLGAIRGSMLLLTEWLVFYIGRGYRRILEGESENVKPVTSTRMTTLLALDCCNLCQFLAESGRMLVWTLLKASPNQQVTMLYWLWWIASLRMLISWLFFIHSEPWQ